MPAIAIQSSQSSIVVVGEKFRTEIFSPNEYAEQLGPPDYRKTVVLPIVANYQFPSSGYAISIEPEKLIFQAQLKPEGGNPPAVLPELLRDMAGPIIAAAAEETANFSVTAIGLNCTHIISFDDPDISGNSFCEDEFLARRELVESRIGGGTLSSVEAKLIYDWSQFRVSLEVAPYHLSDGLHLFMAANVHRDFASKEELHSSLDQLENVREYLTGLPQTFLENGDK